MVAQLWPGGFRPDDLHDLRQYRLAKMHAERGQKPVDEVPAPDWGDRLKADERAAIQAMWTKTVQSHASNTKALGPTSSL